MAQQNQAQRLPWLLNLQSRVILHRFRASKERTLSQESNYVLLQDIRLVDNWWMANSDHLRWLPLSHTEFLTNNLFKISSATRPPIMHVSQSWSNCIHPSTCAPTQHCKNGLNSTVCHCDPTQNVYTIPLNNDSPSTEWACARVSDNPCAQNGTCPTANTQCLVRPPPPASANLVRAHRAERPHPGRPGERHSCGTHRGCLRRSPPARTPHRNPVHSAFSLEKANAAERGQICCLEDWFNILVYSYYEYVYLFCHVRRKKLRGSKRMHQVRSPTSTWTWADRVNRARNKRTP